MFGPIGSLIPVATGRDVQIAVSVEIDDDVTAYGIGVRIYFDY